MYLYKLEPDPLNRDARRDLGNAYDMHRTLSRGYAESETAEPAAFLWRLETGDAMGRGAHVLVQSETEGRWERLPSAWFAAVPEPGIDLRRSERLGFAALRPGCAFRFRLRANPSVCKDGKRHGLYKEEEQKDWLARQGGRCGFRLPEMTLSDGRSLPNVQVSQERMLRGWKEDGKRRIQVYGVLFDGVLEVTDAEIFRRAQANGIGHGKAFGLGLLSLAALP